MELFVESEFKNEDNFRYVYVIMFDSKIVIIEIGMVFLMFEFFLLVFSFFVVDFNRVKFGNVIVVKKDNRVIIDMRFLIRKIFDIIFV